MKHLSMIGTFVYLYIKPIQRSHATFLIKVYYLFIINYNKIRKHYVKAGS